MDQRLPVLVIGGYLGAGKTTLINQLLRHHQGLRLMVLVNDFGDINIDAELLDSADEDTIQLSNGCVCCTLGGDLYQALWDVLQREQRPDCLIIEASGVAQPEKIAQAAIAEPQMRMEGIVTLVDALNYPRLAADHYIGAQVAGQIRVAHLLVLTRTAAVDTAALAALQRELLVLNHSAPQWCWQLEASSALAAMILGMVAGAGHQTAQASALLTAMADEYHHPDHHHHELHYQRWSFQSEALVDEQRFRDWLAQLPVGVYRLKGWVRVQDGGLRVHVVGRYAELERIAQPEATVLVAIGVAGLETLPDNEACWTASSLTSKPVAATKE